MILVDTSVWVDHLRRSNKRLSRLLEEGRVACHPYIVGELACGNLKNRVEIFSLLQALPEIAAADHGEVLCFIEMHKLMGKGLSYIDMCLLVSVRLAQIPIWTLDKRLAHIAKSLGLH